MVEELGEAAVDEVDADLLTASQQAFDEERDCQVWGMLPSEALAVLAAAVASGVTHFFESGISHGQSTEFFARFFESAAASPIDGRLPHPVVPLVGVDFGCAAVCAAGAPAVSAGVAGGPLFFFFCEPFFFQPPHHHSH